MTETKTQSTGWKQVLRIALIPILAVVLLAVCFWPDAEEMPETSQASPTVEDQSKRPIDAPKQNHTIAAATPRKPLPPVTLAEILEHDPFSLPQEVSDELLLGPSPTEEQQAIAEQQRIDEMVGSLQKSELKMVVSGKEGVWAKLGDRIVHEGDEIEPGVRILKITSQGFTLEVSDTVQVEVPQID
jgi:hypothetical protein